MSIAKHIIVKIYKKIKDFFISKVTFICVDVTYYY